MIKKLCIFTISFAFNRQIMLNFLEKIIPRDIELFLFVSKECKGKYSSKRIKIYESNKNKYTCFFALRRFCKKNEINNLFSMGALPQEGFIMAFASAFSRTKSLCHMVVNPFTAYKTGFNKASIKAFFEFLLLYPMILMTDKFYVPIKDIYEKSKRNFFFKRKRIQFLAYPTDTDFFVPKSKKIEKKKLNLPADKKIVIYVGRIEYEKGSDIILELAKLNPDLFFILIGQLFDKAIASKKLPNIKILGPKNREEIRHYYNSADLCIFPSRSEAGPSSARESMACGTQVILPNLMGPRVLCPPAIQSSLNIRDFNKKIREFFNIPPKERKKISQKIREFIVKNYSHKSCEKQYINKLCR